MRSPSILCWTIPPFSLIIAILVYLLLLNPLLSIITFLAPFILGTYLYKNQISWWYSVLFFQGLFISGFTFYLTAVARSWPIFFQNLSLIPLGSRIFFLITFWTILTVPFVIFLTLRKIKLSNIVRSSLVCLGIVLAFNIVLDGYYVYKLINLGNTTELTQLLIETRYGKQANLKKSLRKSFFLKETNNYGSPDTSVILNFNHEISKFELLNRDDKSMVMTMAHWVMTPGEVFWLINDKDKASHIVYIWAYDQEDISKVYISNLKTHETTLLAKGRWLYESNFSTKALALCSSGSN